MDKIKIRETHLKSSFEVSSKIEAFYTGSKVQFSESEEYMFCSCSDKIQVLQVETGKVVFSLREEGDVVTCFAASPDDKFLVTASKSLLLRQWEWKTGQQTRAWKAIHTAPISCMTFDSSSTLLATGSSDSTVKIWDIEKQYYTHNLKGSQGVISLVCFHPDASCLQLFSAADDYKIRIWGLVKSRCLAVLESHFSVVTSLAFSKNGEHMISGSRDNVLNIWDLPNRKSVKTIPAFEGIESVVMLPSDTKCLGCTDDNKEYLLTAGSKGQIRIWSFPDGKCVHVQSIFPSNTVSTDTNQNSEGSEVVQATLCRRLGVLAVVTFDHNIVLYDLGTLKKQKQFVGYNDDILDLCFAGPDERCLAVATNSNQLRVYNLDTMNCQLLSGHSNIVLALDVSHDGTMLVTGSKDHRVCIWQLMDGGFQCVGVGTGHTHAVGSVAWPRLGSNFVVSGSQDYTIKIWDVPQLSHDDTECTKLTVRLTEKVHDKDINSITVSPNDKLLATGSQDKTAKIWRVADGSLVGTLRGHKRGIWCVRFSPVDQCLATSSADATIKIWALSDLSCVKTFEGHDSSVLKVAFMTRGMQLMSCGSEGLMKLWTIRSNECVKTFDQHHDKIWSIALNRTEEFLVSGGADSLINIWKDVTAVEQEEARKEMEDKLLKEQELSNLLHDKEYIKAIGLAISLEQPFRVLKIVKDIIMFEGGTDELSAALTRLRDDQIDSILRYIVEWNTNSRNTFVTQTVLSLILKKHSPSSLVKRANMKEVIEALIPYTQKHFQRMNRLLQQASFVEYTWQSMKLSAPGSNPIKSMGHTSSVPEREDTLKQAGLSGENRRCSDRSPRTNGEVVVVNGHGPVSPADRGGSGSEPENEHAPSPCEEHTSEELHHEETGEEGENNNKKKRSVEEASSSGKTKKPKTLLSQTPKSAKFGSKTTKLKRKTKTK